MVILSKTFIACMLIVAILELVHYCIFIPGSDQIEDALSNGATPETIGRLLRGILAILKNVGISLFCHLFTGF